jgi:hypothetical protein
MAQDREVMGGMAGTSAHLIIAKGNVHAPVQPVLHMPVLTHSATQTGRISGQAGNIEAMFKRGRTLDCSLRGNHRK